MQARSFKTQLNLRCVVQRGMKLYIIDQANSVPFTKTCPSFISTRFSILVTALLVANEHHSPNYSKDELYSPSTLIAPPPASN